MLLGVLLEQSWNVGTAAALQLLEDGHLGLVALLGMRAAKALVDMALEVDTDFRANAVF
jgi:hypothetical protein